MVEYFRIFIPLIIFLYATGWAWLRVVRARQAIRAMSVRVVTPPGNPHAQLYRYADNWAGVPVLDLILKAEDQAQQEHYMAFPEDRPQIITVPAPATQQTINEIRKRYLAQAQVPPMILGDPPRIEEIRTFGDPRVSYYVEGIGMVRAANREMLARAAEVVLQQRIEKLLGRLASLDRQIEGYTHSPARRAGNPPGPRETELREDRLRVFEAAKGIMATMQSKPFGISERSTE